jgi:predicted small metal-binding protein
MPDDKTPACDCGYEVIATDEAGRVEEIRSHAREAHGVAFSIEEALLVLLRSEFDLSRESTESGTSQPR